MRRLTLLFAGGAVWLFLAAIPVFADGGPHVKTINNGSLGINADSCAGCHRAHTAQGSNLLITASQEALCFACHGSGAPGSSTDVAEGVQYTTVATLGTARSDTNILGALRNGGFENARIDTANITRWTQGVASYGAVMYGLIPALPSSATTGVTAVTSSHFLGSTATALKNTVWGNGALGANNLGPTAKLECTSCHNPHGNGQYRILETTPTLTSTSGPAFKTTASTGVVVTDAALPPAGDTRNYTIHQVPGPNYWLFATQVTGTTETSGDYFHRYVPWNRTYGGSSTANVDAPNGIPGANATDGTGFNNQMNAWCAQCHTRLLAPSGAWNVSSGDAVYNYRHPTRGDYPACTTCHVAHGSNAKMTGALSGDFNVIATDGTTNMGSDSFLLKTVNRGTCQMCHEPTKTTTVGTIIGPVSPANP